MRLFINYKQTNETERVKWPIRPIRPKPTRIYQKTLIINNYRSPEPTKEGTVNKGIIKRH